jgi:hypothetical protein
MSVKIQQRFRVIDGIGVEDGQRSAGERESYRHRGDGDEGLRRWRRSGGGEGWRVAAISGATVAVVKVVAG